MITLTGKKVSEGIAIGKLSFYKRDKRCSPYLCKRRWKGDFAASEIKRKSNVWVKRVVRDFCSRSRRSKCGDFWSTAGDIGKWRHFK